MTRNSFHAVSSTVLIALVATIGVACDDAPNRLATTEATPSDAPPSATAQTSIARLEWIGVHDKVTPERWLASRAAGVDLAETDPAVGEMGVLLREAQARFGDQARMIANRAAQLESMLKASGISESAAEIIRSFSQAAEGGRPLDGFGGLCQGYLNLRRQGSGSEQALAQLTKGAPRAE